MYERHGGFAAVRKVVSDFYDRVLDDERLARHFGHTDMRVLVDHQTRFVSFLLGGPTSYSDEHIERVHVQLDISLAEFEAMVLTMLETLEDHDFTDTERAEVEQQLRRRESLIVTAQ
jgi:hemoglobin